MKVYLICNKVALLPTPNYITYMCGMSSRGWLGLPCEGKEAKRSLYMYLEWVYEEYGNEGFEGGSEGRRFITKHAQEIMKAIGSKGVKVSYVEVVE